MYICVVLAQAFFLTALSHAKAHPLVTVDRETVENTDCVTQLSITHLLNTDEWFVAAQADIFVVCSEESCRSRWAQNPFQHSGSAFCAQGKKMDVFPGPDRTPLPSPRNTTLQTC